MLKLALAPSTIINNLNKNFVTFFDKNLKN